MSAAMNFHMEQEERREQAWARKCEYEGWKCKLCGCTPPLIESEIFFETGLCGYHAHMTSKDD